MSKRASVYISDASEKILGDPDSYSGRLNSIISRYSVIMADAAPELTRQEWFHLVFRLQGATLDGYNRGSTPVRLLWAEFDGGPEIKGSVSPAKMAALVKGLPVLQQYAILEVVTKYWQQADARPESLESCGAKIKL